MPPKRGREEAEGDDDEPSAKRVTASREEEEEEANAREESDRAATMLLAAAFFTPHYALGHMGPTGLNIQAGLDAILAAGVAYQAQHPDSRGGARQFGPMSHLYPLLYQELLDRSVTFYVRWRVSSWYPVARDTADVAAMAQEARAAMHARDPRALEPFEGLDEISPDTWDAMPDYHVAAVWRLYRGLDLVDVATKFVWDHLRVTRHIPSPINVRGLPWLRRDLIDIAGLRAMVVALTAAADAFVAESNGPHGFNLGKTIMAPLGFPLFTVTPPFFHTFEDCPFLDCRELQHIQTIDMLRLNDTASPWPSMAAFVAANNTADQPPFAPYAKLTRVNGSLTVATHPVAHVEPTFPVLAHLHGVLVIETAASWDFRRNFPVLLALTRAQISCQNSEVRKISFEGPAPVWRGISRITIDAVGFPPDTINLGNSSPGGKLSLAITGIGRANPPPPHRLLFTLTGLEGTHHVHGLRISLSRGSHPRISLGLPVSVVDELYITASHTTDIVLPATLQTVTVYTLSDCPLLATIPMPIPTPLPVGFLVTPLPAITLQCTTVLIYSCGLLTSVRPLLGMAGVTSLTIMNCPNITDYAVLSQMAALNKNMQITLRVNAEYVRAEHARVHSVAPPVVGGALGDPNQMIGGFRIYPFNPRGAPREQVRWMSWSGSVHDLAAQF